MVHSSQQRGKALLLLHGLGPEGQRIFVSLPVIELSNIGPEATVYMQLLLMLERHFSPAHNVVAERYKFRQRAQGCDEDIDSYGAALRELASTCDFGSMADQMITPPNLEKINNSKTQETHGT